MWTPLPVLLLLTSLCLVHNCAEGLGSLVGGVGQITYEADSTVQSYVDQVKGELNKKLGFGENNGPSYTAVSYKTQIVAGTNYFVKVSFQQDGITKYVHVKIFKPLPHTRMPVQLTGNTAATESSSSPINYF